MSAFEYRLPGVLMACTQQLLVSDFLKAPGYSLSIEFSGTHSQAHAGCYPMHRLNNVNIAGLGRVAPPRSSGSRPVGQPTAFVPLHCARRRP